MIRGRRFELDIDRRRPRTLVEDFIKDARPYESALPDGVEPAAEVLQHFPANSYEKCPDLEAYSRTVREAATGPAVMQYLDNCYDAGNSKETCDNCPLRGWKRRAPCASSLHSPEPIPEAPSTSLFF